LSGGHKAKFKRYVSGFIGEAFSIWGMTFPLDLYRF